MGAVDRRGGTVVDGQVVEAEAQEQTRPRGPGRGRLGVVFLVLSLLFVLPWWTLFGSGAGWPLPVFVGGTVVFCGSLVSFPFLMVAGHGRHNDRAARVADSTLGVVWVLFSWSVLGGLLHLVLIGLGVAGADRARGVAVGVAAVAAVLLAWGHYEAMRLPRVKRLDVRIARLILDVVAIPDAAELN